MEQEKLNQPILTEPVKKNLLIYLLVGILVIFILLSGYFAFAYTKAQKEIKTLNEQVKNLEGQIRFLQEDKQTEVLLGTNKDEFANWKTYENKEFGFEIKYPKDSQAIDEFIDEKERIVINLSPNLSPFSSGAKMMRIRVTTHNYIDCLQTSLVNNHNVGFCAREDVSGSDHAMWKSYEYFVKAKVSSEYIVVSFSLVLCKHQDCEDFNIDEESELFNQILSTFKFID